MEATCSIALKERLATTRGKPDERRSSSLVHNRRMDALVPDVASSYAPAIREILARRFGPSPVRLRHNWFGHGSIVHTAWIGDQTVENVDPLHPPGTAYNAALGIGLTPPPT